MPWTETEFLNDLSARVEAMARDIYRDAAIEASCIGRIDRKYSFYFRFDVHLHGRRKCILLAKLPRQAWMRTIHEAATSDHIRAEVLFEYDVMRSIWQVIEASGESQLCAVRPVGVVRDLNVVVTEEQSLVLLRDLLARPVLMLGRKSQWDALLVWLRLAGRWLRVVHDAHGRGTRVPLSRLSLPERVGSHLDELGRRGARVPAALAVNFRALHDTLAGTGVPFSAAHNDYHLGNIFVARQARLGALDPNWTEDQPAFGDLAKLLIDPVTRKRQAMSSGLSFRSRLKLAYEREILCGYFRDDLVPERLVWLFCAMATLEKWLDVEDTLAERDGRWPHVLQRIASAHVRRYFGGLVGAYLARGLAAPFEPSRKARD